MSENIRPRISSKAVSRTEEIRVKLLAGGEEAEELLEQYYELGVERNLTSLSKETGIPFEVLRECADLFAWDEKVKKRNEDIERAFEARYQAKTKDIRNRLIAQMEALLGEMESGSLGLPFAIKDVADLRALAQAYESLTRANTMALAKAADPHNDDAPTSWADLLKSTASDSIDEEHFNAEKNR